jgi:DNA replication and repair protein RecF
LAIFGQNRIYYREASIYQKLIKSRNSVLKRGGDATLLDSYDLQLASAGARLVTRRRSICEQLLPLFRDLFASIHEDLDATLSYRGHATLQGVVTETDLVQALEGGLKERRELDLRRGYTGYGPHGDDVDFGLKGHLAKEHGSQGQLRSLVLALKLAELSLLQQSLGEAPLLLLDDVASELDAQRRRRLFETIADLGGQTLITVTDPDFLPQLPSRTDFRIDAGRLV